MEISDSPDSARSQHRLKSQSRFTITARVFPTLANLNVVTTSLRPEARRECYAHEHEHAMSTASASSPMPVDLLPVAEVDQDQMITLSHGPEVSCLLV